MNIIKYILHAAAVLLIAPGITSCLGDDDNNSFDYNAWKNENETYYTRMEDTIGADGKKVFEKITPVWAPGVTILAQWHNDRSLTASNLVPMDNSTVKVTYDAFYVNGVTLDSSKWAHTGSSWDLSDSTYICKPSDNIVGFWAMLTNMHVGDSVTCVIPQNAAYGASSTSTLPYSTLVYHMKLKAITAYEVSAK